MKLFKKSKPTITMNETNEIPERYEILIKLTNEFFDDMEKNLDKIEIMYSGMGEMVHSYIMNNIEIKISSFYSYKNFQKIARFSIGSTSYRMELNNELEERFKLIAKKIGDNEIEKIKKIKDEKKTRFFNELKKIKKY